MTRLQIDFQSHKQTTEISIEPKYRKQLCIESILADTARKMRWPMMLKVTRTT